MGREVAITPLSRATNESRSQAQHIVIGESLSLLVLSIVAY